MTLSLLVLAAFVLAAVALHLVSRLEREMARLRAQLDRPTTDPEPPSPDEPSQAVPEKPPVVAPPLDEAAEAGRGRSSSGRGARSSAAAWQSLESRFARHWMVWTGGIALALGGSFLVRYAAERGLLGPSVRVSLGFLLGLILIAGGEWLRRRPFMRAIAALEPSYVPPALTAGGLVTAFASIYAAHALYGLIPAPVALLGLCALAASGIALAWLHGPMVALVGMVGGYLVPALVSTGQSSAWALFAYLIVLASGCQAVLRTRSWPWLGRVNLAGALVWPLLWLAGGFHLEGPVVAAGLYLVLLAAVNHAPPPWPRRARQAGRTGWLQTAGSLEHVSATLIALLVWAVVERGHYGPSVLVTLALLSGLYVGLARLRPVQEPLAIIAAGLCVLALASRDLSWFELTDALIGDPAIGLPPAVLLPEELAPFAWLAAVIGLAFGLVGFIAAPGAGRPGLWAGLSAAVPLIVTAIAYARITAFGIDLRWSGLALMEAFALLAAAQYMRRGGERHEGALGAYALGVVAALALAATMALEQAWLTVALALLLPAMAWIHDRLGLAALRGAAWVVATIVTVRLALKIELVDLSRGFEHGWLLYGYGIPMVAFLVAARWFGRRDADRLVILLQSGALLFWVMLVGLEIRYLIADLAPGRFRYGLLEQSLQAIAWLFSAYGLLRQLRTGDHVVPKWGAALLAGLATAQVAGGHLVIQNPVLSGEPVGAWPLVNVLFLAYAVPAGVALMFQIELRTQNRAWLAARAAECAGALTFVYLSMEVRRAFHGSVLLGPAGDAEWLAYSIVWLGFALGLMFLGILRHDRKLRTASLLLVLATIIKVFLFDLNFLDGLYRAASFLGLGLLLLATGLLYQRFVLPPGPADRPLGASSEGRP